MKYPFYLILFLYSSLGHAQTCTCSESFRDLITSVEENYALFTFKVSETRQNIGIYEALKRSLLDEAQTTTAEECAAIYRTYIDYFNDRHLRVTSKILPSSKSTTARRKIEDLDTTAIYAKLNKQKPKDPLIGVWESDAYKVMILEEEDASKNRDYVALVVTSAGGTWGLGEIKMEISKDANSIGSYKVDYYMGNRELKPASLKIKDEQILDMTGLGYWRKVMPLKDGQVVIPWDDIVEDLDFKDLGNGNYYINIESFGGKMSEPVAQFVKDNHDKLLQANSLIIDVRNNGGGNDYTYYPLLPYIHSGPVTLPNVGFWLSEENNKLYNEWWPADQIDESELEEDEKKFLEAIKTQRGVMIYSSDEEYGTNEIDTIYSAPKHVAIITNKWSASSAETFVYNCSQSDRVVTFGQNTAGVVDGFNGNDIFHDCFTLRYPTCVRTRNLEENAIDPHGIIPDVLLAKDKKDIIPFIVNFFKQLD